MNNNTLMTMLGCNDFGKLVQHKSRNYCYNVFSNIISLDYSLKVLYFKVIHLLSCHRRPHST